MLPAALVTAPLILAAVLALSGVAKLRDHDEATQLGWEELGVPARVNVRWVRRSHPWAELVLAAALVVAPGPMAVVAGVTAVALCLVYLVLVARAAARPEPAVCDCFGATASTVITWRTVARNLLLALLGVASLVDAVAVGSPWEALAAAPASTWWWLLAVAAAALTTHLVAPEPRGREISVDAEASGAPLPASRSGPDPEADDEYIRTLTPMTHVVDADGITHDLVSMSAQRPQLLLFVSPECGACTPVVEKLPEYRERIPLVQIRLVVGLELDRLAEVRPTWTPSAVHDPDRLTARALRVTATPTAVLLGTDGMLAGGPVEGSFGVEGFVEDIAAELEQVPVPD